MRSVAVIVAAISRILFSCSGALPSLPLAACAAVLPRAARRSRQVHLAPLPPPREGGIGWLVSLLMALERIGRLPLQPERAQAAVKLALRHRHVVSCHQGGFRTRWITLRQPPVDSHALRIGRHLPRKLKGWYRRHEQLVERPSNCQGLAAQSAIPSAEHRSAVDSSNPSAIVAPALDAARLT